MFAKTIIDSDAFLDMPLSTQALYFHLSMRADDDGFINSPRKIQRVVGASDDDLKLLIAKNFIIPFESGVVVIKHWRIHNYIQKDRYTETVYQEEKQLLSMKENKAYTINANSVDTKCIQNVSNMDAQVSIGKLSIVEDRLDNKAPAEPTVASTIAESGLTDEVQAALREFSKMRTKIKAGMTANAMRLTINSLKKLSNVPEEQEAIVNQSIEKSWKGLFPLKDAPRPQEPKAPTGAFYFENQRKQTAQETNDYVAEIERRQREERARRRREGND